MDFRVQHVKSIECNRKAMLSLSFQFHQCCCCNSLLEHQPCVCRAMKSHAQQRHHGKKLDQDFEKRIKRACTCWMESRQDFKCLERLLRVNKNAASHYVNVICNVVCDVRGVSFLTCQFSIFIMNTCVFLRSMLMGVWVFDCISLWKLGGMCLVVLNLCLFSQSHCLSNPWTLAQ